MRTVRLFAVLATLSAVATTAASAAEYQLHQLSRPPADIAASWTAERAAALGPMHLEAFASLEATFDGASANADGDRLEAAAPVVLSRAQRPTAEIAPSPRELPLGRDLAPSAAGEAWTGAPQVGTAKLHFTSSRVLMSNHFQVFPLSTVGRLVNADGWCTASVVSRRIIVTAAHCVHDGKKWLEDIAFVPGFTADVAPLGVWPATAVVIPQGWVTTQGKLPNKYDYAFVELVDATAGGNPVSIRDVVGALGLVTAKIKPNHLHILGYPSNIDQGKVLHEVTSGDFVVAGNATVGYGSDMGTGSSGGPWIQNFGVPGAGQKTTALNTVVGVTSYIITNPTHLASFTSAFDAGVTSAFKAICKNRVGNC